MSDSYVYEEIVRI